MGIVGNFTKNHPDLFLRQSATVVHPHDQLMARTVLCLFPATVTPNQVTMFRALATPFVFALIVYNHYLIGMIAFLLVAFTDVIDGSMARTRNQITNFGILLDPLVDKFLIGSMVLILVFENFPRLGFAVLGIEIVIILSAFIAKIKFKTIRAANIWGKIKMSLQVVAVFFTLVGIVWNHQSLLTVAAWLFGLSFGFAVLSLFSQGL